jgi:2-phosphosulfolactate phosphatase
MARGSTTITAFPENAHQFGKGYAVVAVDVIRATTTAVTAVASGRRCLAAGSREAAFALAQTLSNPLLAGELDGSQPEGFEINNSPVAVASRSDTQRPLVLLSTSGTRLLANLNGCDRRYVTCFRNAAATAAHIAHHYSRIALIGAGSRGEFREEDQMCCAWVAARLADQGYEPDEAARRIIERWSGVAPDALRAGNSAAYLRRTGQDQDLEFILERIDDVAEACELRGQEVMRIPEDQ